MTFSRSIVALEYGGTAGWYDRRERGDPLALAVQLRAPRELVSGR